jgi:hypothetical protein
MLYQVPMRELSCQSHNGSVTHYYHFFFACLVPLIDFRLTHPHDSLAFTTDVGSFHSILTELPLNLSFSSHESSVRVLLPSYDIFDQNIFTHPSIRSSSLISSVVRENVLTFLKQIPLQDPSSSSATDLSSDYSSRLRLASMSPLIVLIGRDPHATLLHPSSGFARRHIRNHQRLEETLRQKYPGNFLGVYLERLSFLEQFHLFQSTSVLIAQHGAALSNIFFMSSMTLNTSSPYSSFSSLPSSASASCSALSPLSHVIEISPPYSRRSRYFRNLADTISVSYSSIYQQRNKGNVSIDAVMRHVDCVLTSWGQKQQRGDAQQCDHHTIGRLCGDIVGETERI